MQVMKKQLKKPVVEIKKAASKAGKKSQSTLKLPSSSQPQPSKGKKKLPPTAAEVGTGKAKKGRLEEVEEEEEEEVGEGGEKERNVESGEEGAEQEEVVKAKPAKVRCMWEAVQVMVLTITVP